MVRHASRAQAASRLDPERGGEDYHPKVSRLPRNLRFRPIRLGYSLANCTQLRGAAVWLTRPNPLVWPGLRAVGRPAKGTQANPGKEERTRSWRPMCTHLACRTSGIGARTVRTTRAILLATRQ
jgi:hypothetical protein